MKSSLHSLLLIILVGALAAAVNRFAQLSKGDRAARPGDGYGNPLIRTGPKEYPREAIDSDSFVVRIARPARRFVSQYWSIDESVYSVVPPERVVAVSESAYEERFSNVYWQAWRYHPVIATDPERVLRLDPDLLIVSNSSRADFCAIVRTAQVPIYRALTMFTTLEQVAETIRLTGYLTGEDTAAERQIERSMQRPERLFTAATCENSFSENERIPPTSDSARLPNIQSAPDRRAIQGMRL
jgi:ABC-type Fe3+-hydroxamate transport system substrate-binding protein